MLTYKSIKEESVVQRRMNEALAARTAKNKADVEYLAMMTDVELETEESEESENGEAQ